MNILTESIIFFKTHVLPTVSKRHRPQVSFGFQALTMQPFTSLNANARMIIANRSTAESKIFRLVSNKSIPTHFTSLVTNLGLVTQSDVVNVDFSSFCGFEVLTFAKQTHLGRALPLYFATIQYPIVDPTSQTLFVIQHIKKFKYLLGFCPLLVFDRGFESHDIVYALLKEDIPFMLRLKKDKHILYQGKDIPLRNLPWYEKDTMVTIYEQQLRIVVSEKRSERTDSQGNEESWYILTNDEISSKERIIARYYFRFELEETFKDLKHINKLKHFFSIKKPLTFAVLLWFCILTIWLSFLISGMKHFATQRLRQKKRKRLSIPRFFFEQIQQAKTARLQEVCTV